MKKFTNWLFDNGYLPALVIAAVLTFIWQGIPGFWVFIPVALMIAVIQMVMLLAKAKKEQKAKMVDLAKTARPAYPAKDREYDYSGLPEMAEILTNGNEQAVRDIALLAQSHGEAFIVTHPEWCEAMEYDADSFNNYPEETIRDAFAYWLCGYEATDKKEENPAAQFGGYIDWKEETESIIWSLENAAKNLGYGLELDTITFTGHEFTDKALNAISRHLAGRGYVLLSLDTQSDCYHLFVIQNKNLDRLMPLAEHAGFRFIREF